MKYQKLIVGDLQTNCYLVWNEDSRKVVIIDPADESDFISDEIQRLDLIPEAIWLTHGHFDHVLAALDLKLIFNIPIIGSKLDSFLIDRTTKTANYFGSKVNIPEFNIDKETIDSDEFEIMRIPGHTPGSIGFYTKKENLLFSGDVIFRDGVGRTDFSYGNAKELNESIEKIKKLPEDTLICPGHGEEFVIGQMDDYYSLDSL